jgi:hypothetical protein
VLVEHARGSRELGAQLLDVRCAIPLPEHQLLLVLAVTVLDPGIVLRGVRLVQQVDYRRPISTSTVCFGGDGAIETSVCSWRP